MLRAPGMRPPASGCKEALRVRPLSSHLSGVQGDGVGPTRTYWGNPLHQEVDSDVSGSPETPDTVVGNCFCVSPLGMLLSSLRRHPEGDTFPPKLGKETKRGRGTP